MACHCHIVTIKQMSFLPKELTVKVGECVAWCNIDNMNHNAQAEDNSFVTETLKQSCSKFIQFDKPGKFPYKCGFHGMMTGTIIVQNA